MPRNQNLKSTIGSIAYHAYVIKHARASARKILKSIESELIGREIRQGGRTYRILDVFLDDDGEPYAMGRRVGVRGKLCGLTRDLGYINARMLGL